MEPSRTIFKGSIPRTILRLAIPMTVAQLINILYNIVDRMYIGHIDDGRLALTGIGITLPIISILMGFAICSARRRAALFNGQGARR